MVGGTCSDLIHAQHRPLDPLDRWGGGDTSEGEGVDPSDDSDLVAVLEAHGLQLFLQGIAHDEWKRMRESAERLGQPPPVSVFDGRVQTARLSPPADAIPPAYPHTSV